MVPSGPPVLRDELSLGGRLPRLGGAAPRARIDWKERRLRIAVDINDLHRPQSGIGRYIGGLLSGFAELGTEDELVLFHRDPLASEPDGFETRRLPGSSETWWAQVTLPRAARAAGADVLLCPAVRAPVRHGVPVVLVVHDVIYAIHPHYYTRFDRTYMRVLMRLALPRCERIVAVSQATADDLRRRFSIERVTVIHNGVEPRFRPHVPERVEVPGRYVLFVGTLEPRKNVPCLLEAFAQARRRGIQHTLVLAGKRGWKDAEIVAAIERAARDGSVRYLGHVPDAALPDLYAAADLVTYPSSYEGFGLPVLEAMASGVPVVATRAPGIEEVAGDACLLVRPRDVDELADALVRATTDEELRRDLVARGVERAAAFTWTETARRTLEVCREARR